MFFEGSSRSTRRIMARSPTPLRQLLAHRARRVGGGRLAQRVRAHRDRERPDGRGVAVQFQPAAPQDLEARQAPRRQEVVLGPLLGLESRARPPPPCRAAVPRASLHRKDAQVGGAGERRVREVHDLRVGHQLAEHPRHEAEVVVLDQEDGVAIGLVGQRERRTADSSPRTTFQSSCVASSKIGERGDVPQVVVHEPQDAVRDLVVVALVALRRDHDEAHALVGVGLDRAALQGHRAVALSLAAAATHEVSSR